NLQIDGGTSTLAVRDSSVSGDSVVVLVCTSTVGLITATSTVILKPKIPGVPREIRGALTAFGPIDKIVSDMVLDGRNHDANNVLVSGSGKFGVSTGESTFSNDGPAQIGGTDYAVPVGDIAPSIPEDPLTVEVNAPWPDGWPTTPDGALGLPDGTLKSIALSGVGGSRYVTNFGQLMSDPIQGVTYVEVPPGTEWNAQYITVSPPEGILVFHSSSTDAMWWRIKVKDDVPFKGIMILDRVFHLHMDILGAMIHLSPNTVTDSDCQQNQDHWINYSEETIENTMSFIDSEMEGGWRDKFEIVSWWE
ncbi:MAG: hypothetical protein ACE5H0_10650, partial [Bacteroidota bacterium]